MSRGDNNSFDSTEIDRRTFDTDGFKYVKDETANTKLTTVIASLASVVAAVVAVGVLISTLTTTLVEVSPLGAFGERLTADLTPVVQVQFPYNLNTLFIEQRDNNGTSSWDAGRAKVSTGASANQSSAILTREALHYNPGQGALARFTTIYTAGVANSSQIHGVGDSEDGYFFGYNGATFGVLRRDSGQNEIRTLTVSTASSHAENITITLDGDADAAVAVTNTANTTLTANEIAAHDFSDVGEGWRTFVDGATVVFISYDTGVHTGTYSLSSATSAVGTFAQTIASNAATDTWITQANWNGDTMDGNGASGMTLDQTKGNVYQIRYQWLGFGKIQFFIEHDEDGLFELVHEIKYTNTSILPSVQNPTLPFCMMVQNTSNTTDLVMFSSSMAGFTEGRSIEVHPVRFSISAEDTDIDEATLQPILSIRNNVIFASSENRTRMKLQFTVAATSAGNKPVTIHFHKNVDLTSTSWVAINGGNSVISYDISATAVSGGVDQFEFVLNSSDRQFINLIEDVFLLNPGDVLTAAAIQNSAGTNSTVDISFNWVELF